MQIELIFALIITLSGDFVAFGQKKDTKNDLLRLNAAQNNTNVNEEKSNNTVNSKNTKLTGIPQVDYIYDPNLPRELRGYNLSSYPFFSSVPPEEDIHFKCDGLHDGFYASIEHKCQIYHHCVYGIRHDFLCANFTAFDQKTFICHFVSDVDCEGSKKYWNRNDDLYMPTTTTTTSTTTTEPPSTVYRKPVRPQRPLRRPLKRRPSNDYYYYEEYPDEFYEEPVNRRPISNRPRPRKPIIEYDYEEEIAPRRSIGSRYRFRTKNLELEDDYQESQTSVKQHKSFAKADAYDAERDRSSYRENKHHAVDDEGPQATTDISRRFSVRRRISEKRITQANNNEPPHEGDAKIKPHKIPTTPEQYVSPKAGNPTIYGLPRTPPRIGRPVPIHEKKKYEYPVQKAVIVSNHKKQAVEEDYADVEDFYYNNNDYDYKNEGVSAPRTVAREYNKESIEMLDDYDAPIVTHPRKRFRNEAPYKHERIRKNKNNQRTVYADYEAEMQVNERRIGLRPLASRSQSLHKRVEEIPLKRKSMQRVTASGDEQKQKEVSEDMETRSNMSEKKNSDFDHARKEETVAPVRVMKRPFLPSRGGSPYLPRGLHLVGMGNKNKELNIIRSLPKQNLRHEHKEELKVENEKIEESAEIKEKKLFYVTERKPTDHYFQKIEKHELQTSQSENSQHTLDLFYGHDYDVTINDALNPTLTPLSSQSSSHQLHRN